eukprot:scaffold751_cov395-Prasinococcus_capsulatus_cf.AAC.14
MNPHAWEPFLFLRASAPAQRSQLPAHLADAIQGVATRAAMDAPPPPSPGRWRRCVGARGHLERAALVRARGETRQPGSDQAAAVGPPNVLKQHVAARRTNETRTGTPRRSLCLTHRLKALSTFTTA